MSDVAATTDAPKSGLSTKAKVFIGLGTYLAIAIVLLLIFGNNGKNEDFKPQNEFKLEPWISIHIAGVDIRSTGRSSTCWRPAC